MNKFLKNTLIILAVILVVFGVIVNVRYFTIASKEEKREVFHTYIVGDQERVEDSNGDGVIDKDEVVESKPFIEVIYNKDTYFCVKFNYFMNEERTGYYTQVLEYSTDKGYSLDDLVYRYAWRLSEDTSEYTYVGRQGAWEQLSPYVYHYWNGFVYGRPNASVGMRVLSGSEFVGEDSASSLNEDSLFRIQVGEDIYALGFAGRSLGYKYSTGAAPKEFKNTLFNRDFVNTYYSVDPYFIAQTLYNSVKEKEESVVIRDVREYVDLFTYRKYNAQTGKYDLSVGAEELSLVSKHVFSYLGVQFSINQNNNLEAINV